MAENLDILFSDLPERHKLELERLKQRQAHLRSVDQKRGGSPPPGGGGPPRGSLRPGNSLLPDEKRELERVDAVLDALAKSKAKPPEVVNPLFVGLRDFLNEKPELLGNRQVHNFDGNGKLTLMEEGRRRGTWQDNSEFEPVVRVALLYGLLAESKDVALALNAGAVKPAAGGARISAADASPKATFKTQVYAALGKIEDSLQLATKVLSILDDEGDWKTGSKQPGTVRAREFAQVVLKLTEQGVTDREPQLRRRVNEALNTIQAIGGDQPLSQIEIALPDFDQATDYQIQRSNVEAIGSHICAAMLDELKAFEVVEKLVELWQQGTLPVGRGDAGEMLYRYWRDTPNRMSEAERRGFYAMTLGQPGGAANGPVNRDFNDLWIRFVSSVSSLVRQSSVEHILRQSIPASVGQQQVRKAARDLALNLSLHGYGMVVYAAVDLQKQVTTMITLLGQPEIMSAYGARDMWQVIDQVATLELGGARNSARYRTLATCGAIITKWLGQNVARFNKATSLEPVIDLSTVLTVAPASAGRNATTNPTDYDLVNACELWLADTAVDDDRIERFAQPREAPIMTSRPVAIPAIAREMLEQAGVPALGLGLGVPRH